VSIPECWHGRRVGAEVVLAGVLAGSRVVVLMGGWRASGISL
jgi:hypothetical protein